ncbi:MAG TPA: hypothetical protein VE466_12605, partial [Acidimicrobiales bacterium]|nr:hypothetical protein [Acidimicrobiales bacterium]
MRMRLVVAGVTMALPLAGCSADSQDPGNSEVGSAVETPWEGFEASAASISVGDDGTFDRQLRLLNVSAADSSKGLVLGVHPATVGVTVWTSELPKDGRLILCSASLDGGRQSSCQELDGDRTRESIYL